MIPAAKMLNNDHIDVCSKQYSAPRAIFTFFYTDFVKNRKSYTLQVNLLADFLQKLTLLQKKHVENLYFLTNIEAKAEFWVQIRLKINFIIKKIT